MNKTNAIGIPLLIGVIFGGFIVGFFASISISNLNHKVELREQQIARLESKIMCDRQKDMSYDMCKALLDKE